MILLAFRSVCSLHICLLLISHFVPFKCVQFVRELTFVVVARGVSAGCEEKGRESCEQRLWDSWATAEANCPDLVLLTGIFFFSYKATGSKFKS